MFSGHSKDGFTLLEIMISMAVTSIAMTALVGAFSAQQRISTRQDEVAELQQNARAAVFMLENDIRMAGFKGVDDQCNAGITVDNVNDITFTYCADADGSDNDGDGTIDETGELATVTYDIYDGNGSGDMDLGRQVGGVKRVVAERINGLIFTYFDGSGTSTATVGNIRSVQVDFTAQAVISARSGDTDTGLNRSVKMNIKCRNLGL